MNFKCAFTVNVASSKGEKKQYMHKVIGRREKITMARTKVVLGVFNSVFLFEGNEEGLEGGMVFVAEGCVLQSNL